MATIDPRLVVKELRKIASVSQGVKKCLRDVLERIEDNPSDFSEVRDTPGISAFGHLVAIRKAKVINQKHDYRILFAHWRFKDGQEHVDLLMAFPREDDYKIDWEWIEACLQDKDPD